jgi:hypothetical protein
MENNIKTLTRDEQTQIRMSLKVNIEELKRMIEVSKRYKIDYTTIEQQVISSEQALEKLYGASNIIITK